MNNGVKKMAAAATAAVMMFSALSMEFARPLKASEPLMHTLQKQLEPLTAQVLASTSADAGAAGLEQLSCAIAAENDTQVSDVCDTLTELLESELAGQNLMKETSDDPVVEARRQEYLNAVAVRAGRTRSALDAVRSGTAGEAEMAVIREAFAENNASHRSNATPSSAAYITGTKTEEGKLTQNAQPTLPAAEPTIEESLQNDDTEIPKAISDLAAELGSAKEIYRYVKENVVYEAYSGSKKGAAVTLDQLGGNDVDQARLLIALLRAIHVPARYVTGTVEITADQAVAITGAADAKSAGRILEARHKGVKGVTDQGVLVGYRMEQTWVEAYVPYTDYRGAGAANGRSVWVSLDPSFKTLTTETQTLTFNYDADQLAIREHLDAAAADQPVIFGDYTRPGDTADVYLRRIDPVQDGYLPASLPYTVLAVNDRYAALPDEMKDSIAIEINGEQLFSAPLTELYFKQITVSYVPATDSDKKLLNSDDKLTEVPAYLVQMLPVVTVRGDNGTDTYTGKQSAALGAMQQMTTTLKNEGDTTILTDDVFAGSMYAFNLDYQRIMPSDINYSYGLLKAAQEAGEEANSASPEILGALLDYAGKSYFAYCDSESMRYETMLNICKNRQLGLCITGYEFRSKDTLGIVDKLEGGAFFIDVAYNNYSAVSYEGNAKAETGFNTALGESESYYEGKIWEIVTGNELHGISTVSVMNAAADQNIPTAFIVKNNAEEQLEKCHVSESVKDEVRDFVNKGMMVQLVADTVAIGDWTGTAYIARDMRTGAASYMLSGGTAGGSSDCFDRLFKLNMLLFQATLAVSTIALTQTFVKIHLPSPSTKIDGVMTGLDTAKVLGEAFTMYFDNIDFIFDYAMEGDDMLERYAQFTLDNLNRTVDYIKSTLFGALSDLVGGVLDLCKLAYPLLEEVFEAIGTGFDAMNEAGSDAKAVTDIYSELPEGLSLDDDEYERWFEEYNQKCLETTLGLLSKLLKSFVG